MNSRGNVLFIRTVKEFHSGINKNADVFVVDFNRKFSLSELKRDEIKIPKSNKLLKPSNDRKLVFKRSARSKIEYDVVELPVGHGVQAWNGILAPYVERIYAGARVYFMVSPDSMGSAVLCMAMMSKMVRNMDADLSADEKDFRDSRIEDSDEGMSYLPEPVGYVIGRGCNLHYDDDRGKLFRWTCWWPKILKYGSRRGYFIPDRDMREVAKAASGFDYNSSFLRCIDKDAFGWPVAFSISFRNAKGKIIVLPASVSRKEVDALEDDFKSRREARVALSGKVCDVEPSGATLHREELVNAATPEHKSGKASSSSTAGDSSGHEECYVFCLKTIDADIIKQSGKVELEVKRGAAKKGTSVEVTVHQFLKFAGLWAASVFYGSYVYRAGKVKSFIKVSDVEMPCIAIYRNSHNEPPRNFHSDRIDCFSAVFKGVLSWDEVKKKVLGIHFGRRKRKSSYIDETICNVSLEIKDEQMDNITKLKFKSNDSRCNDYESGKSAFFSLLKTALSKRLEK